MSSAYESNSGWRAHEGGSSAHYVEKAIHGDVILLCISVQLIKNSQLFQFARGMAGWEFTYAPNNSIKLVGKSETYALANRP